MVEVRFYDTVNDELLKFAVIISLSNGKWVFCKHKERDTYEVPGETTPQTTIVSNSKLSNSKYINPFNNKTK